MTLEGAGQVWAKKVMMVEGFSWVGVKKGDDGVVMLEEVVGSVRRKVMMVEVVSWICAKKGDDGGWG